jgi:hypothetical protein
MRKGACIPRRPSATRTAGQQPVGLGRADRQRSRDRKPRRASRRSCAPDRSFWVALRIAEAAHSNPIWIEIADQPVRVVASAKWCAQGIERCWTQKGSRIRASEHAAAQALYDRARVIYLARAAEAAI